MSIPIAGYQWFSVMQSEPPINQLVYHVEICRTVVQLTKNTAININQVASQNPQSVGTSHLKNIQQSTGASGPIPTSKIFLPPAARKAESPCFTERRASLPWPIRMYTLPRGLWAHHDRNWTARPRDGVWHDGHPPILNFLNDLWQTHIEFFEGQIRDTTKHEHSFHCSLENAFSPSNKHHQTIGVPSCQDCHGQVWKSTDESLTVVGTWTQKVIWFFYTTWKHVRTMIVIANTPHNIKSHDFFPLALERER